ncbi:hypothetical protein SAMN04515671_2194 [Nakamurella panacisegetis]|uniref:Lactonase, 7-bladed beta-propeller n=1 Tax=Nakamurella panacisegetis TaxID=1090615 RepID=A0A1H0N438_9ACTN|nr:hypothetical protein [Nakamurella panacisegetis]SDO87447.1 hypothetical protein SAMN04515671_2194 [Nakamurella panacisegetis]
MWRLPGALALMLLIGGCTVAGSAAIAPYVARPAGSVSAHVVPAPAGFLALAPNGTTAAVADAAHGVCLVPVVGESDRVCAATTVTGRHPVTAMFAPDGRTVALGQGVDARGRGTVALVDVATGGVRPIPPVPPGGGTSFYVNMAWNRQDGHLLLISGSSDANGLSTRVVDVDPASLVPRVVAVATGPYEFQSGHFVVGGDSAVFTAYRVDQIPPDLIVIDTATGTRREFGPLGPGGTQAVPLAVAPDGRHAVVGFSTYGHPGPPQVLDLKTGALSPLDGVKGDYALAAYSPDGRQLACVTSFSVSGIGTSTEAGAALRVQIVPAGFAAVTVGTVRGVLPADAGLAWSGVDSLGITSPTAMSGNAVAGWSLG